MTTFATVPADAAEVGTGGLASRRGPSTGLAYVATADPRFRRTERLRLEVPLAGEGFTGTGRLLTREGQATPLIVSYHAHGPMKPRSSSSASPTSRWRRSPQANTCSSSR